MSALFSLCPRPPSLLFIPLCFAAVTHLLRQQMEQGKHSEPCIVVHPQVCSLFLLKALELGIFLGLLVQSAGYTFLLCLLSEDYKHICFIILISCPLWTNVSMWLFLSSLCFVKETSTVSSLGLSFYSFWALNECLLLLTFKELSSAKDAT